MRFVDASEIARVISSRVPVITGELALRLQALAARWPDLPRDAAQFAAYVAARSANQPDPLAGLHVEDLALAWWAGSGEVGGITAFEAEYAAEILRIAGRFPSLSSDELAQQLRIKLFVGAKPKIRDYSGAGSLLAWLRVVAVRSFVDLTRAQRSAHCFAELDEVELLGATTPATASVFDAAIARAIKRAFADAVAALTPRQRAFLRHAYVDQLTLDQIAASYVIHRATVARTLAGARAQLIEQTRRAAASVLEVAPDQLASAIGALEYRLELSLSRVLRAA